jgi:hypothetical protein
MELLADRDQEARRALDPVLEHMMEPSTGTRAGEPGDGRRIMALFGAPLAHGTTPCACYRRCGCSRR